jgi:hypothetical protein
MVLEGARKLGMDWTKVGKYRQWMDAAGFVGIKELSWRWPTNAWPEHEHHKLLGQWTNEVIRMGLHGISIEVLTAGLGMRPKDVELLLKEVNKDLDNKSIHCYVPMYALGFSITTRSLLTISRLVVYGQKPE